VDTIHSQTVGVWRARWRDGICIHPAVRRGARLVWLASLHPYDAPGRAWPAAPKAKRMHSAWPPNQRVS